MVIVFIYVSVGIEEVKSNCRIVCKDDFVCAG